MADRATIIGQYMGLDAARADQQRFEAQSLAGEFYAELGLYGLHFAKTRAEVEELLRVGAPVDGVRLIDWRDGHQHWETPLLTAYVDQRQEVVDALLEHGADVDAPNAIGLPNGAVFGHRALHTLATSRAVAGATHLLKAGADVNRQTTLGWTPLHFAAQNDDREMVVTLLDAGSDRAIRDLDGELPADFAGQNTRHLLS